MKSNQKIVIIVNNLGLGGAEKQIYNFISELYSDFNFTIISIIPSNAYLADMKEMGVEIVTIIQKKQLSYEMYQRILQAMAYLRNADLVVTFNYHANILGRIYKFFYSKKLVVTSIRSENFGSKLRDLSIKLTDSLTDMNLFNSKVVMLKLVERRTIVKKPAVIYNGIDTDKFIIQKPTHMRLKFSWLIVANHKSSKGYKTLLSAARILLDQGKNFEIICIGDGPLLNEHKEMQIALKLQNVVNFLGYKDDILPYLANANAFVLPSDWEGFPNVLLEASLTQLPIVATEVGGVVEVAPKIFAEIVRPNDPSALANAMATTMETPIDNLEDRSKRLSVRNTSLFSSRIVNLQWRRLFENPTKYIKEYSNYSSDISNEESQRL